MVAQKTADQWFAEYGDSHRHPANEVLHWICVPVIFCAVLGFIWMIPVPPAWQEKCPWFNWSIVGIALASLFYFRLSPALSAGLLLFMALSYGVLALLESFAPWPVGTISCVAFALAWAGQFAGHLIERRKPSFLQDLVFLLIGPAWLMSLVYRKLGQNY